ARFWKRSAYFSGMEEAMKASWGLNNLVLRIIAVLLDLRHEAPLRLAEPATVSSSHAGAE
ncbi:MAG TPA: hypothetical protein VK466_16520, partial [Terriglobales bacterium]|nr:hypothetical protein [Terriglobales bacterium]